MEAKNAVVGEVPKAAKVAPAGASSRAANVPGGGIRIPGSFQFQTKLKKYRKYNIITKGIEGCSNAWHIMSDETKEVVLKRDLRDKIEEEDYNIDFVQSFEVAEHIEKEYADVFIYNLIKDDPDIVLLTAAPPDQHGFQHVNCKEREYWMVKMKDKDYLFNQDLLNDIKDWGTPDDCPFWWPSNLMVFV